MKTRVYYHRNGNLAVAWRQDGCRKVWVHYRDRKPHSYTSFKQANVALLGEGFVERVP